MDTQTDSSTVKTLKEYLGLRGNCYISPLNAGEGMRLAGDGEGIKHFLMANRELANTLGIPWRFYHAWCEKPAYTREEMIDIAMGSEMSDDRESAKDFVDRLVDKGRFVVRISGFRIRLVELEKIPGEDCYQASVTDYDTSGYLM